MRRFAFFAAILVLAPSIAAAQTSTWVPDKQHSEVDFSVLHMSLSNVHGRFNNIGGSITINDADVTKSTVNVTIDVTTVDTGQSARDNDLKGATFFDVAQFPTATFVSTSVAKNGAGLTVAGNLTVHGITKPVTLQVESPNGPLPGLDKRTHFGYSATTTISRTDFGLGTKYPAAMLSDQIKLNIELDVAKQ
jgi:polyisoprenoid-binding protein YceI